MEKRFYRKRLNGSSGTARPEHPAGIRHPSSDDGAALAQLMLDGYRGTIDYEGEGLEDAVEAIDDYFASEPLPDHSHVVMAGDAAHSAILMMRTAGGEPMVSYVMTAPKAKGRGLAARLLDVTLAGLAASGEASVCAYITDGNTPSERLFKRAGFVEVSNDRAN